MFSRRWIINYALVVLIIVFTYVGNRFTVETGYQPQQPVTGLKPADIESIVIQTADISLTLQRDDAGWLLQSPIQWPANNVNVERLLDIAYIETDSRLPADEIDLSTLGLEFPRAVLRLNDTRVLFGATNNIGARRYTMVGSTVYLLPDVHLPFILQGTTGLVDRRLLPGRFELDSIKLPDFEIARDEKNAWRLVNADDAVAPDKINALVENWRGLEAAQVKFYDSAKIPRQKIRLRLKNGQSHDFFVMSIDPEIVIANPGIGLQYHFSMDHYYQIISLRPDETAS
jgi:hypothetical protein